MLDNFTSHFGSQTPFVSISSLLKSLAVGILLLFLSLSDSRAHEITVTNHIHFSHSQKWNPKFWFGNADDPVPPADYRPNDPHRITKWYWRNPTHNFNFYIIGISDKTFRRAGRCPDQVFNPHGGWNWTVCKYKWARLPFISYHKRKFSFYFGWRERGNFGIKLNFKDE